jgi:hypothetical protein
VAPGSEETVLAEINPSWAFHEAAVRKKEDTGSE